MSAQCSVIELLAWTNEAWKDYIYWQSQDKKTLKRINKLISDTQRSPFEGIGKPEPLKASLTGFWSRRIDESNRLVYAVDENKLTIISCRYYYEE
ncbi:MAG: toxin YoeB [Saprospiraceae bacterium]